MSHTILTTIFSAVVTLTLVLNAIVLYGVNEFLQRMDMEPERRELVVHDIYINPSTLTITQTRTASVYPLPVSWESKLVDAMTEETICKGHGFATVEENATNSYGPVPADLWTGGDCSAAKGRTVAAIGTWYWTDIDGSARYTRFRSNATVIPSQ